jgi:hypothetical protein
MATTLLLCIKPGGKRKVKNEGVNFKINSQATEKNISNRRHADSERMNRSGTGGSHLQS